MTTVSMAIHTDNQLHAGQFGKAVHTEGYEKCVVSSLSKLSPIDAHDHWADAEATLPVRCFLCFGYGTRD